MTAVPTKLSNKDAKIAALIGTGGQAATQLEAIILSSGVSEIRVSDLNFERAQIFVEEMKVALSTEVQIIAVKSATEAVTDADIIVTVTPSRKPVFDGKLVKPGAFISGVGSYQPEMQEIPAELVKRANKIYFDSEKAVLSEAGDLLIPLKDGDITEADFTGDLGDVINGKLAGRESKEEIIFFKTVGIAAQDLFTAKSISDKKKTMKSL